MLRENACNGQITELDKPKGMSTVISFSALVINYRQQFKMFKCS